MVENRLHKEFVDLATRVSILQLKYKKMSLDAVTQFIPDEEAVRLRFECESLIYEMRRKVLDFLAVEEEMDQGLAQEIEELFLDFRQELLSVYEELLFKLDNLDLDSPVPVLQRIIEDLYSECESLDEADPEVVKIDERIMALEYLQEDVFYNYGRGRWLCHADSNVLYFPEFFDARPGDKLDCV